MSACVCVDIGPALVKPGPQIVLYIYICSLPMEPLNSKNHDKSYPLLRRQTMGMEFLMVCDIYVSASTHTCSITSLRCLSKQPSKSFQSLTGNAVIINKTLQPWSNPKLQVTRTWWQWCLPLLPCSLSLHPSCSSGPQMPNILNHLCHSLHFAKGIQLSCHQPLSPIACVVCLYLVSDGEGQGLPQQ